MQVQLGLETEDSLQCFIDSCLRQDAVLYAFLHGFKVFFQVTCEQEDIGTVGNAGGNRNVSRQYIRETGHTGSVCNQQTVEAHLLTQQFDIQLFRKAGRQDVLIGCIRAEMLGISRLGDMYGHDCLNTVIDQSLIDLTVGVVPLLCAQPVDRGQEVLVTEVNTVTGEMLRTRDNTAITHTARCGQREFLDLLGIGTESPDIGNRVERVHVNVHNRTEVPVRTDRHAFFTHDLAALVSHLGVSAGCHEHLHTIFRTV